MTMLLEEPTPKAATAAQQLRATMAAVRVSLAWLGVRKALTSEQKSQAAETFGAESAFLSAGKKLLDTQHPAYKGVTGVRTRIVNYWKGLSLPYPEPGLRLIRQEDIPLFNVQLTTLQAELAAAVAELDRHYGELRAAARRRLGRLFNDADYPASLTGLFQVEWDFPSVEPPQYLRQLSPELYEQECARVRSRFAAAVELAEEAFTSELAKLVSHLAERLTGAADGKPKIFRDSALENLREFFERFRHLHISSSPQLEALVGEAQGVLRGVQPQALRDDRQLREVVSTELVRVQSVLDGLLVDRPRRQIVRRAK